MTPLMNQTISLLLGKSYLLCMVANDVWVMLYATL